MENIKRDINKNYQNIIQNIELEPFRQIMHTYQVKINEYQR